MMETDDTQRDEVLRSLLKPKISMNNPGFENEIMNKLIRLSSEKEERRKAADTINNFIIIGFCLLTVIVFALTCADKTVFLYFKTSFNDWPTVSNYEDISEEYRLMLIATGVLSVIFLTLHWILSKKNYSNPV
jgi:hypothetical protein